MGKPNGSEQRSGNGRVLECYKGLSTLVIPIVAAIATYYGTTTRIQAEINVLKNNQEHLERDLSRGLERMRRVLERIEGNFDSHRLSGRSGVPHAEGAARDFADLDRRVKALEADR